MLGKIKGIFKFVLYAPLNYERWAVFQGTKRRALDGSVVNQKDLAEMYFEKNNIKEAFAWAYVAGKNGSIKADILQHEYSKLLSENEKKEAEKLAEYYYKNFSKPI